MLSSVLRDDNATVHIVERDPVVARGIALLLEGLETAVKTYSSAEELLSEPSLSHSGCLVIEVNLPGMGGLELLKALRSQGIYMPAILLTSKGDIPTAVRAMRAGALDFLEKPFLNRVLVERVRQALESAEDSPG
jgi:two-component system response regulator FixJ